ncbi:hypothetical protein [Fulvimonas soli]|nr:hypothetical protein [Fulvimonas soli]
MIGCVLALGGIGAAQATDVNNQDLGGAHAASDAAPRDGTAVGGDVVNLGHDGGQRNTDGDTGNAGSAPAAGGGGGAVHPQSSHRSALGWQSLLPGSIQ